MLFAILTLLKQLIGGLIEIIIELLFGRFLRKLLGIWLVIVLFGLIIFSIILNLINPDQRDTSPKPTKSIVTTSLAPTVLFPTLTPLPSPTPDYYPLEVYFILDGTGSMDEMTPLKTENLEANQLTNWQVSVDAINRVVSNAPFQDRFAVIIFGTDARLLNDLQNPRDTLIGELSKFHPTQDSAHQSHFGLQQALNLTDSGFSKYGESGARQIVILITDAHDWQSNTPPEFSRPNSNFEILWLVLANHKQTLTGFWIWNKQIMNRNLDENITFYENLQNFIQEYRAK
ncbi:MAG TPA: VWA domain-containing protein [Anaerolineales bacterium]|nr:VWA domain-containing protein [Anaerolineales bacterium]